MIKTKPNYKRRKIDEDKLKKYLYIQRLPYKEISLLLGVGISAITWFMRAYDYPNRGWAKGAPLQGKKHTEKTRKKISLKLKGKKAWNKKYPTFFKCRECGAEFKHRGRRGAIFCSKQCHITAQSKLQYPKGLFQGGSNHPNWKGDSITRKYPTEFNKKLRRSVRKRDNYKCQICGCPEIENVKKLHVHHRDCNKNNNNLSNLVSLCEKCHMQIHWNKIKERVTE